jgi:hypothetical protein
MADVAGSVGGLFISDQIQHVANWQILLQKAFWGGDQNFSGTADAFRARRYGPPHRFVRKRSPIRIGATEYCSDGFGQKLAFARFSTPVIFVFCNNIGTKLTD